MTPDIWFPHLGIELNNVSRLAFSVFGFGIYWYAIFVMIGIFVGYQTAIREAKRTGQRREDYTDLLMVGVISAIVGLRLFYVLFNLEYFYNDPIRIITGIRDGGLAIFGGIISSIVAVSIFAKKRKLNAWVVLDTCAPSFAIGQVIGRWGNFFNREAFGSFTDNLFAMRIVREQAGAALTPDILDNIVIHQTTTGIVEYIQVHPTFFYESMANLAIFIALTIYRPHKRFNSEIFWLYLTGYGFVRFLIEGLRVDQLMLGVLPVSRAMAAIIFVCGLSMVIIYRLKPSLLKNVATSWKI
ncbi:MAG: prolipoprotein diacylglyceryl transferase [Turicibacter sp.]|nr:prolipoprotein diacylglyceryl transferase [Turicibacter sp.]